MRKNVLKKLILAMLLFLVLLASSPIKASASQLKKAYLTHEKIIIEKGVSNKLRMEGEARDKYIWRSSNSKVIKVSSKGKMARIKALTSGTATIKVVNKTKKLYSECKVMVVVKEDENQGEKCSLMYLGHQGENHHGSPRIKDQEIKTYDELQTVIKKMRGIQKRDPWVRESMEKDIKKLKSYDKSYFKNNVLYIKNYVRSTSTIMKIRKVAKVLKPNGKYKLRFTISNKYSMEYDYTADSDYYLIVAESGKSDAKNIDQLQVNFIRVWYNEDN